jgi:ferredoxin
LRGESSTVKVGFPDGSKETFEAGAGEYVLGAAHHAGLYLPSLCEVRWGLACAVKVVEGEVDQCDSRRYFEEDGECGFALICTGKARSDLMIVPYQTKQMRQ